MTWLVGKPISAFEWVIAVFPALEIGPVTCFFFSFNTVISYRAPKWLFVRTQSALQCSLVFGPLASFPFICRSRPIQRDFSLLTTVLRG